MASLRTGASDLPIAARALICGSLFVLTRVLGGFEILITVLDVNLVCHSVHEVVVQMV